MKKEKRKKAVFSGNGRGNAVRTKEMTKCSMSFSPADPRDNQLFIGYHSDVLPLLVLEKESWKEGRKEYEAVVGGYSVGNSVWKGINSNVVRVLSLSIL